MKVKLVAFGLDLYYAWRKHFKNVSAVEVIDGDILQQSGDAIVSPANSFGYMDGGLDLKYSQHFGWDLEAKVRNVLEREHYGEIPVGNAIVVETLLEDIPFLISAPTMRVPMDVSQTVNAYLAFKAVLTECMRHNQNSNQKINTVLCPGLGTGEGRMDAETCACQMRRAYDVVMASEFITEGGLASAVSDHLNLLASG